VHDLLNIKSDHYNGSFTGIPYASSLVTY